MTVRSTSAIKAQQLTLGQVDLPAQQEAQQPAAAVQPLLHQQPRQRRLQLPHLLNLALHLHGAPRAPKLQAQLPSAPQLEVQALLVLPLLQLVVQIVLLAEIPLPHLVIIHHKAMVHHHNLHHQALITCFSYTF